MKNRTLSAAALAAAATLAAAGCGSASHSATTTGSATRVTKVTVVLTSAGCTPSPTSIPAGTAQFTVTNTGASAVSEAELRTANLSHIVGEAENVTPGLRGSFSVQVSPGTYKISCPGASRSVATLAVTGRTTTVSDWHADPQLAAAVKGYDAYIASEVDQLVTTTRAFTAAVEAGNRAQAEADYPKARIHYERIEPVAEIWGNLDTEIDGRVDSFTSESAFVGFHRLEQALWENQPLTSVRTVAAGLLAHVEALRTLTRSAQYTPIELTSGSTDLINEIERSKITGEEERYSDVDFVDFEGNLQGAAKAVSLLAPYLRAHAPGVLATVDQREAAVRAALARYAASPGYDGTGWVSYAKVTDTERRQLSAVVDALAEAVSKTTSVVGG